MGLFSGIAEAKASFDANYMRTGVYWAKINKLKKDKGFKKREYMAVELVVVKIIENDGGKSHKEGEEVSVVFMEGTTGNEGRMKAFVVNVVGCKPEEVTEERCMTLCSDKQPLAGTVVEIVARPVTTKAGKAITGVTFKREVPAKEVLAAKLRPDIKDRFFPNNFLESMAE